MEIVYHSADHDKVCSGCPERCVHEAVRSLSEIVDVETRVICSVVRLNWMACINYGCGDS